MQSVSLPTATPLRVEMPPEPEWGVHLETTVVGVGAFRPTCRGAEDEFSAALHAYKGGAARYGDPFRGRLQQLIATELAPPDRAVVVPSHDGGRPSHLRELVEALPIHAPPTLARDETIPPTKRITDRTDRWTNVAGTTDVQDSVDGECVVVVDDVFASGASLGTAAAALREAGASRVTGAVLGIKRPSPYSVSQIQTPIQRTN